MKRREKGQAIKLRKKGWSVKEIERDLGVARSTVSVWVREVELSKRAQERLKSKMTLGQLAAQEGHRKRTAAKKAEAEKWGIDIWRNTTLTQTQQTLLCSIIYWCEGVKLDESVIFTNSDPDLIAAFLKLLRSTFPVDESRFRVCMHLHSYHDAQEQKKFWSKVTGIPPSQFIKPYQKPNTGRRYRDGYPGCIQVRYYDRKVARKLLALAQIALKDIGA